MLAADTRGFSCRGSSRRRELPLLIAKNIEQKPRTWDCPGLLTFGTKNNIRLVFFDHTYGKNTVKLWLLIKILVKPSLPQAILY
jgi:hypothetical protein